VRLERRNLAVGLLAAALLAACGELPRPFQRGDALPPDPIERAAEFDGISVLVLQNVSEAIARPLAQEIARWLRSTGVPASSEERFQGHFTLGGRAAGLVASSAERPDPIADITWRLTGPSGRALMDFVQRVDGSETGWRQGDPALIEQLALGIAPEVSDAYHAAVEGGASPPARTLAAVALGTIEGLEDQRRDDMVRALRAAFTARGLQNTAADTTARYKVGGVFEIAAPGGGRRPVGIVWTVTAADGQELGKIEQRNFLPDPLDVTQWRQISAAIASGTADGIVDLLRRAGTRPGRPDGVIK
jgi:hypothetical protein